MQDEIEGVVTGRRAERVVAATREPGRRRVVVRRPRLRLERSDQRLRALGGAVGDGERGRRGLEQRPKDPAGGAAGAQHQYMRVPHADTEPREIGHQASAVGVVAQQPAVRLHRQRVDRRREPRAVGEVVGEPCGGFLVRYRDIHAAAALREEPTHRALEVSRRGVDAAVLDGVPGGRGEVRVDHGRAAVRDRMADHGVAIGGGCRWGRDHARSLAQRPD